MKLSCLPIVAFFVAALGGGGSTSSDPTVGLECLYPGRPEPERVVVAALASAEPTRGDAFVIGGTGCKPGTETKNDEVVATASVEFFDQSTEKFAQAGQLPKAAAGAQVALLISGPEAGTLLITGGHG